MNTKMSQLKTITASQHARTRCAFKKLIKPDCGPLMAVISP